MVNFQGHSDITHGKVPLLMRFGKVMQQVIFRELMKPNFLLVMLGRAGAGVPPLPPTPAPSGREGGAPQVKEAWGCEALLHHRTQSAIRATGWVKGGRWSLSLHLPLASFPIFK